MSEKGKLSKALLYAPENGFDRLPEGEKAAMHDYCESYKDFLNHGKTERLCVEYCIELAKQHGFVEFQPGMALKTGDKVYCNNRGKGIMLAVIGKEPLSEGANIAAAHTDAPRLDLKPRPLYEEAEMAYFKTHHYGGIRKYQWVTIPLELHGVVTLCGRHGAARPHRRQAGGSSVHHQRPAAPSGPRAGQEAPERGHSQREPEHPRGLSAGGRTRTRSHRFKLAVMQLLHEKYGMVEEDFISAELEAVPAGQARDIGFDRSLIASYGHDDRVCAYAELAGLFDAVEPQPHRRVHLRRQGGDRQRGRVRHAVRRL